MQREPRVLRISILLLLLASTARADHVPVVTLGALSSYEYDGDVATAHGGARFVASWVPMPAAAHDPSDLTARKFGLGPELLVESFGGAHAVGAGLRFDWTVGQHPPAHTFADVPLERTHWVGTGFGVAARGEWIGGHPGFEGVGEYYAYWNHWRFGFELGVLARRNTANMTSVGPTTIGTVGFYLM